MRSPAITRSSLRSGQRLGSRSRTSSPIDSPIQQVDGPHPEVHDEPVGPLCVRWVNEQLSQNSDNADDRPSPQQELSEELHQEVQDLQELLPADPWFGRLHQDSQELSQDVQQELEQVQDQELMQERHREFMQELQQENQRELQENQQEDQRENQQENQQKNQQEHQQEHQQENQREIQHELQQELENSDIDGDFLEEDQDLAETLRVIDSTLEAQLKVLESRVESHLAEQCAWPLLHSYLKGMFLHYQSCSF